MPQQSPRQYEAIVFGATGYTGKYASEHIMTDLPTDFKWAIAGRSEQKLKQVAEQLRTLNPDRQTPGIEIAQLERGDLLELAKKTKVLISTVGPYHKYGSLVVEACAETGTHYLDVTGEVPWVYDMIEKYDATAKKNNAIMIPQNGIESAPVDLLVWALVSRVRETLDVGTKEVVLTIHDFKATASGGTMATVLSLLDSYSLGQIAKTSSPWALSAATPPQQSNSKPIIERLTGVRIEPDLGTLADSIQGPTDTPIVHRTWGLYSGGKYYGSNFYLSAYKNTTGYLKGFAIRLAMTFGFLALALPPVRWALKKVVYQPGDGPTKEQSSKDFVEWRAIATADNSDPNDPKRVFGRMRFDGSMYHLTGILLAEAAITIARDQGTQAHELGGGMLTPATLGVPYLERLKKVGLDTEIHVMPGSDTSN